MGGMLSGGCISAPNMGGLPTGGCILGLGEHSPSTAEELEYFYGCIEHEKIEAFLANENL